MAYIAETYEDLSEDMIMIITEIPKVRKIQAKDFFFPKIRENML